jgi:hypothetical protein
MLILNALTKINWLTVLICWIAHVVISLLWFQPFLFGKAWVRLSGKEMKPATQWIPAGFIAHFICIVGLAIITILADAMIILDGIWLGLMVAFCFIGSMLGGELVWEKIPFKLFLIRLGDQLLTLTLAGAILAYWR